MNAVGVGIDLVEVDRVTRLLARNGGRATERLLTPAERDYCFSQAHPAVHVAARLAAKEAAFKALSLGGEAAYHPWREFEVTRARDGVPTLEFHGKARARADQRKIASALLSLTHTTHHAAAVVILLAR